MNKKLGFLFNQSILVATQGFFIRLVRVLRVCVCVREDLLLLVDVGQRSHLTALVSPKHLAEGTGGDLAAEAVDVHLLPLVV